MQKSFWWWQCSERYAISLFCHFHTPFPTLSPSLIGLIVSVDGKHHVYLLTSSDKQQKEKKKEKKEEKKGRKSRAYNRRGVFKNTESIRSRKPSCTMLRGHSHHVDGWPLGLRVLLRTQLLCRLLYFTRMPAESYRRRLRFLFLCQSVCDGFWAIMNSLLVDSVEVLQMRL